MNSISFVVPTPVRGLARHRTTRTGHTYDPRQNVEAKNMVAIMAKTVFSGPLIEGPVWLVVMAYKTRPKSMMGKTWADEPIICPSKPDWDNIGKLVSDALNGIVWRDDRQIVSGWVQKFYCEKSGTPRLEISIKW